jgi:hypothetical protein
VLSVCHSNSTAKTVSRTAVQVSQLVIPGKNKPQQDIYIQFCLLRHTRIHTYISVNDGEWMRPCLSACADRGRVILPRGNRCANDHIVIGLWLLSVRKLSRYLSDSLASQACPAYYIRLCSSTLGWSCTILCNVYASHKCAT